MRSLISKKVEIIFDFDIIQITTIQVDIINWIPTLFEFQSFYKNKKKSLKHIILTL